VCGSFRTAHAIALGRGPFEAWRGDRDVRCRYIRGPSWRRWAGRGRCLRDIGRLSENRVELRSVSKRFGDVVAVDRVDLGVCSGEFLTLLGPSGCGKTTILRMISGFEQPSEGRVFLAGRDVTELPPYRRDVNQVFQSYALFPHLSVWENVAFGLKMKRARKAEVQDRAGRAIEMVALGGFEQRMPHQLSGGQKQRVALARALVCEPQVLLLDEPLAALDAKLRRAMQIELKRLQARLGITFIFVTHDQEEALVMSDRIAVVNAGKIEQLGAAAEIYHHPQTRFVADFLGAANVLEMIVERVDGAGATLIHSSGLRLLAASLPLVTGQKLVVCVRPERIQLTRERTSELAFAAAVREALFRGASRQLRLETASGVELTAITANDDPYQPGDAVHCEIGPEDVVPLHPPRQADANAL
jgi:spermidine/putrescine transport system ATP-binding protein